MAPTSPLQHVRAKTNGAMPKKAATGSNVQNVILGNLLIKPWYHSFYPEELVGNQVDRLYVCQWCFKYSKELMPFLGHTKVCQLKECDPPGSLIYSKDSYSIREVDGEEHTLYTQNLSLFAKLFLDTKSVLYDLTTFLYYLLVSTDPRSGSSQVIGFFSKEKMSWDNNNLACILVFPPWQRQGFGQILMGVSYELAKKEGRLGGPEKPLSDLGRRGYLSYWSSTIARHIMSLPQKRTTTVRQISEVTYILPEDIIVTLQEMGIVERKKKGGADVVVNKAQLKAWAQANRVSMANPVDPDAFCVFEDMDEDEEEEIDDV